MEARMGVFNSSATATPNTPRVPSSAAATTVVGFMPLFIHDQRMQWVVLQFLAPVEKRQLDHERDADHLASQLLDQTQCGGHRPAGREQVIDGEHALTGPDGVFVHRQRVTAVLELVFYLDRLAGQLAELAHRDEAGSQLVGDRTAENEPAG